MAFLDDFLDFSPISKTPGFKLFEESSLGRNIFDQDKEEGTEQQTQAGSEIPTEFQTDFNIDDQAFRDALALGNRLFDEARQTAQGGLSPFIEAGTGAIPGVQAGISDLSRESGGLLGDIRSGQFDPRGLSFTVDLDSPEFQSILEGGTRAIDTAAATSGLLGSGARLRDLTEFGQEAVNRFTGDVLNRRLGLASNLLGQRTTGLEALRLPLQAQQNLLGTGLGAAGTLSGGLFGAAGQQAGLGADIAQQLANLDLREQELGLRGQELGLRGSIAQQELALKEQLAQQAIEQQEQAAKDARSGQIGQLIGGILGTAGGAFFGGPAGAGVGGSLGSSLGGSLGI